MTTIVYDRRTMTIGADTQNTSSASEIYRSKKIEVLKNKAYFLGSGHSYGIGLAKQWAEAGFDEKKRPDFTVFLEDPDTYSFACLVVHHTGKYVWRIDDEMTPILIYDEYTGVGSGAAYALGALDAGATVQEALGIAEKRDPSTSGPFDFVTIEEPQSV